MHAAAAQAMGSTGGVVVVTQGPSASDEGKTGVNGQIGRCKRERGRRAGKKRRRDGFGDWGAWCLVQTMAWVPVLPSQSAQVCESLGLAGAWRCLDSAWPRPTQHVELVGCGLPVWNAPGRRGLCLVSAQSVSSPRMYEYSPLPVSLCHDADSGRPSL